MKRWLAIRDHNYFEMSNLMVGICQRINGREIIFRKRPRAPKGEFRDQLLMGGDYICKFPGPAWNTDGLQYSDQRY
jgi:hypothetical protein